jgi:hypothetical protein
METRDQMMLHPDQMLELGRQRQEELLASSAPFAIHPGLGHAARFARRQVGLALIRLGSWLGGHAIAPIPTARLAAPPA